MDDLSTSQRGQLPAPQCRRRYKTAIACTTCRRRKVKCDGASPTCARCRSTPGLRDSCTYAPISPPAGGSTRGHAAKRLDKPAPASPVTILNPFPQKADSEDPPDEHQSAEFSSIRAAVTARLGLESSKKRCPIPFTDAPMFGSLTLSVTESQPTNTDGLLPPRREADSLLDVYWRHLHPLDPLLDKQHFRRSYQALFSGAELDVSEDIFLATLNLVFALSTQVQELVPAQKRHDTSTAFFLRAWRQLRPDTILWGPASVDVVQCLLLMTAYLRCTKNLHQTWMVLGSAVRIAQSLELDLEASVNKASSPDAYLRRCIWRSCANADRRIARSIGRNPMTFVASLRPAEALLQHCRDHSSGSFNDECNDTLAAKMMQVNETMGYIMAWHSTLKKDGSANYLQLQTDESDIWAQVDEYLTQIENSLPAFLKQSSEPPISHETQSQLALLHLRVAHARGLLFRPMLARFCLWPSQPSNGRSQTSNFRDRLLMSSAIICVESAERVVQLVRDISSPSLSGGKPILPWWLRFYYLVAAGNFLITAMLRPDTFLIPISETWETIMSTLVAHEHISQSVTRCISKFRAKRERVANVNRDSGDANAAPGATVSGSGPEPPSCSVDFQELLDQLGLNMDGSFDMFDGMEWLQDTNATF